MDADFDPYYKWLGIPPEEQPADHYRLLGLRRFESDPEVIESAADRQMSHVRSFQSGKRGVHSQLLLNQIAAAKVCLLRDVEKSAYDRELKQKLRESLKADEVIAVAEPLDKEAHKNYSATNHGFPNLVQPQGDDAGLTVLTANASSARTSPRRAKSKSPLRTMAEVVLGGFAGVAIAIAIMWYGLGLDPLGLFSGSNVTPPIARDDSPSRNEFNDVPASPISPSPVPIAPATLVPPTERPASAPPAFAALPPAEASNAVSTPEVPGETPAEETVESREVPQVASDNEVPSEPSATPPEAAGTAKAIPPGPAAEGAALTRIGQIFEREYAEAKTSEQKVALANLLLRSGKEMQEAGAEKFVLLRIARDIFNAEGELAGSLAAISSLDQAFQIDPLQQRAEAHLAACKAPLVNEARQAILEKSRAFANEMVAAQRFDLAVPVTNEVMSLARKLRDTDLVKSTAAWRQQIHDLAEEHLAVQSMRQILASDPENGEANLAVGLHLAVTQNDWEQAIGHLAKSNDPLIRSIATTEQATPVPAMAAADGWWNAADLREEKLSEAMKARAVHWYRAAWGGANSADRSKIEQRVSAEADKRMDPNQWTLHCWVDKQWKPHSLELVEHSGNGNEVRFRNTVGIYGHVQLRYLDVTLPGDFYLELEFKGTPRTIGLVILGKRDAKGSVVKLSSPDWKKLILRRTAGEMTSEVDGKPYREFSYWNVKPDLKGPPEIALDRGEEVAIRNMVILH